MDDREAIRLGRDALVSRVAQRRATAERLAHGEVARRLLIDAEADHHAALALHRLVTGIAKTSLERLVPATHPAGKYPSKGLRWREWTKTRFALRD